MMDALSNLGTLMTGLAMIVIGSTWAWNALWAHVPPVMSCAQYLQSGSPAGWFVLEGCELDLSQGVIVKGTISVGGNTTPAEWVYVPVLDPNQTQTDPTVKLLLDDHDAERGRQVRRLLGPPATPTPLPDMDPFREARMAADARRSAQSATPASTPWPWGSDPNEADVKAALPQGLRPEKSEVSPGTVIKVPYTPQVTQDPRIVEAQRLARLHPRVRLEVHRDAYSNSVPSENLPDVKKRIPHLASSFNVLVEGAPPGFGISLALVAGGVLMALYGAGSLITNKK